MNFPAGIWNNVMWKMAARAGLRRIADMVTQGNIAGASRIATTPGVLKPSAAGSQIRALGHGSEGIADLVAHPQHGVAVRKTFDPKGISGQGLIDRKAQAGQAMGANPAVAQFKGQAPTPHGGGTMHFSEFVGGKGPIAAPAAGSPQELAAVRQTKAQTQMAMRRGGFGGGAQDVRKDNMVWDPNGGRFKTIDYIPQQRGEFYRPAGGQLHDYAGGQVAHMPTGVRDQSQLVAAVPGKAGEGLFNQNYTGKATPAGQLRGQMFGGKVAPAPIQAPKPSPTHSQVMGMLGGAPNPAMAKTQPVHNLAPAAAGIGAVGVGATKVLPSVPRPTV